MQMACCRRLESIAAASHRRYQLTEFGGNMNDSSWWTGTMLKLIMPSPVSYALGWRNAGASQTREFSFMYYAGRLTAGFCTILQDRLTLFQKRCCGLRIYQ